MAVVHLHIDTAIRDGTGTYAGVQFASVFHAQQIYRVTATNDYRAVNWNAGTGAQLNTNERATIIECAREFEDRWWPGWEPPERADQERDVLDFGHALRARGLMTDNILEGYWAPNDPHGDEYGFNYDTPRALARTTSFVNSADGHYNGVPDFSTFMNHVYNNQAPGPASQPYGGGDPIKV